MYGKNEETMWGALRPKHDKPKSPDAWKELAKEYHKLRMTRAKSQGYLEGKLDGANYLLFGLSAAVGKVMTNAKRLFGGDTDKNAYAYADALASVRIYVEQLARESEIDLDAMCYTHMQEVLDRMDKK